MLFSSAIIVALHFSICVWATNENIDSIVENVKATFESGRSLPLVWRVTQLKAVIAMLSEHEQDFLNAVKSDLGRSEFQTKITEFGSVIPDCRLMIKNLPKWIKPTKVSVPLLVYPATAKIVPEPLGTVLMIGPWNFPVTLSLTPLLGAIAAGNCAILKPSEHANHVSDLLARLIPEYLDAECIVVVQGAVEETTALLQHQFDHIFFTGSESVGRIVYEAAAKHMTPVTLELGGKSPAIIDESANLQVAANRILFGKTLNAGQICMSPDYVLIVKSQEAAFYQALSNAYAKFFPNTALESQDYSRIINNRNYERLIALVDGEGEDVQGKILFGGRTNQEELKIEPTVFMGTSPDSKLMKEEIFGPYLPVLTVDSVEEAFEFVKKGKKPLAAYLFSKKRSNIKQMISSVSAGGILINDVILHYSVLGLPFGGIGASGIGVYRGKHSFDTLSHMKPVLHHSPRSIFDPSMRYPPYSN